MHSLPLGNLEGKVQESVKGDTVAWLVVRRTSMPWGHGSNPAVFRLHSNTLRQGMNP